MMDAQNKSRLRKAQIGLFIAGFTTFAALYSTQSILPNFSRQFHITPAAASLSLSISTLTLAVSLIGLSSLSEVWGRKKIILISLFAAAVFAIGIPFVPDFKFLLLGRMLQGLALGGVPAVAMAYLGEEFESSSLGFAMGLYISGNILGGMSGRMISGLLADIYQWRIALGAIGILSVLGALICWMTLPRERNFQRKSMHIPALIKSLTEHLKNPFLLGLYSVAFLAMGSFAALYNYIGYQLIAPPYSVKPRFVNFIYIVYIAGSLGSTWMGHIVGRYGRRKILWITLLTMLGGAAGTLCTLLFIKIIGIVAFTFGFFGAHSVASSWVSHLVKQNKAQASSLYLFFYYVGLSVGGTTAGVFWSLDKWAGVTGMIGAFLLPPILMLTIMLIRAKLPGSIKNQFVRY